MADHGTGERNYWRGVGDERESVAEYLFDRADPDYLWQILLPGVNRHGPNAMKHQLAVAIERARDLRSRD